MVNLPFANRSEAGRLLGAELVRRKFALNAILLALPRGGLPVGVEVADALSAPLDVIVVRKLGVPWQPELGMGAVAGGTRVLDHDLIRDLGNSDHEVEAVVAGETQEIVRRERLYWGGLPAPDLQGRAVVLVVDGLATGSTMVAAARHVRGVRAQRVIIAVPVGTLEACERLRKEADEGICLALPEPFNAIGEWYADFLQVTDAEVREMLNRSHHRVPQDG